jgi:hypothetical protein
MNDLICPLCDSAVIEHEFVDNGYVCYGTVDYLSTDGDGKGKLDEDENEYSKRKVLEWLEKMNDKD